MELDGRGIASLRSPFLYRTWAIPELDPGISPAIHETNSWIPGSSSGMTALHYYANSREF